MNAATIYERDGKVFIHASSKTTAGVWVLSAPVLEVQERDPADLGKAIRECLEASGEGVPHPKSFTNLFDPVLALAGVRSFNTFVKSAKCVEVEMDDGVVTLIPTRNEGVEEGFVPLANRTQVELGSDEQLGTAALSALSVAA